ncbi:hypothetical protein ILUMI_13990, partial [Ignelater luminosus]
SNLAHFEQIQILAETYTSSIIILSETCITTDIEPFEVDIQGHISVRCDSHSKHTGGVFVLIRKDIRFTFMSSAILEKNAWILSVKILEGALKGIYTVLYHSPNSAQFLNFLQTWCEENLVPHNVNYIIGDFNIDVSKTCTYSKRLMNFVRYLEMKQIVKSFTRVTENSKILIDLVITNAETADVLVLEIPKITDHYILQINNGINNQKLRQQKTVLDRRHYSGHKLQTYRSQQNWDYITELHFNDKAEVLNDIIKNGVKNLLSTRHIRLRKQK